MSFPGIPRGAGERRSVDQLSLLSLNPPKEVVNPHPFGAGLSNNYPCNKRGESWHSVFEDSNYDLTLRKKTCQSAWCPTCSKIRIARKISKRMRGFKWEKTRQIILTIDRNLFNSGLQAWTTVREGRLVAEMMKNLKRVVGLKFEDWVWILEFHEDGFPHWHLFVQVDKPGAEGMIGGDLLRKYWGLGRVIEIPIYSRSHWYSVFGYFEKHGYFHDEMKTYQAMLPEWGLKFEGIIKKYSSMLLPLVDGELRQTKEKVRRLFGKTRKKRMYEVILEECGKKSRVMVKGWGISVDMIVDTPYKKLRENLSGQYVEGIGFKAEVSLFEIAQMAGRIGGLWGLVDELLKEEEAINGIKL